MKKFVLVAFAASAILAACEQQGPLEEAGEDMDDAIGTEEQTPAEEAWDDTTDQVEEAVEESEEAWEEATDDNPEDGAPH